MADTNPLAVPPPTSLYPQPPSQQGALSGNPTQLLDLIGTLTKNQILQNELKGRTAVGQAYQGAIQPDGTLDPNRLAAGLRNPDAAWALPETMTHLLNQQSTQFDLLSKQSNWISDRLGALAAKRNLSMEDVNHFVVDAARDAGVNPAVLVGWQNRVKDHPGGVREAVKSAAAQAIGSAGLAGRVEGPPGTAGEKTSVSVGQTVFGGQPGQPMSIGQPPGEAELQTASAGRAAVLQATASTTAQTHADLENLRQLGRAVEIGGPTVELEKRLAQIAQRLGLPSTLTARQLASAEEFDKIANLVSIRQTGAFHASDAALHTVIGANPSLSTTRFGRDDIIAALQGQQDAVDRLRNMWNDAHYKRGIPANRHDAWVNDQAKIVDPRLFQFNRLSKEGQAKFWGDLDPADRATFKAAYRAAIAAGWVKDPKWGP